MEWNIPPNITNSNQRSSTSSSKSSSTMLNNLTHYTQILQGNKYNKATINTSNLLFLKKREFDIFYSTKYKYPLLVAETITAMTGMTDPNHPFIDRRQIEDPFRQDPTIPFNLQHTLEDYKAYMEYGGSMGHNAPAGQHKTNMDVYSETFVLTNITPQEMVFNSGLWVLMEQWCRYLGRNSRLKRVMVFTGSIPARLDSEFNGVIMNVPSKMFKIICFQMQENPDICHLEIFLCHNKPYNVDYSVSRYDLSHYLVPHTPQAIVQFQRESGVDIKKLLEYYKFSSSKIKSFRSHLNISINLNSVVRLQMKKSHWFGRIIYARDLATLESEWTKCQKFATEFQNLQFHQEYYELAKRRIQRGSRISRTMHTIYTRETMLAAASKSSRYTPDILIQKRRTRRKTLSKMKKNKTKKERTTISRKS